MDLVGSELVTVSVAVSDRLGGAEYESLRRIDETSVGTDLAKSHPAISMYLPNKRLILLAAHATVSTVNQSGDVDSSGPAMCIAYAAKHQYSAISYCHVSLLTTFYVLIKRLQKLTAVPSFSRSILSYQITVLRPSEHHENQLE
jgi:hypothetical protein